MILKRFVFEFCDSFVYLLYIGLYELNISLLRTNLVTLFMFDEIRRTVTEVAIPYIMLNRKKMEKKLKKEIKRKISKVDTDKGD